MLIVTSPGITIHCVVSIQLYVWVLLSVSFLLIETNQCKIFAVRLVIVIQCSVGVQVRCQIRFTVVLCVFKSSALFVAYMHYVWYRFIFKLLLLIIKRVVYHE